MGKYVVHRRVDEDLVAIARWIQRDNPAAAQRFLGQAEACFQFIADWPEASLRVRLTSRRLRGIRVRPLARPFHSYLVFYGLEDDGVHIYRVLHGATNWQEDLDLFS